MKRKDIPKATPRKFHAGGGLTPMYGPRPISGVTSAMPTPTSTPDTRIRYATPVPAAGSSTMTPAADSPMFGSALAAAQAGNLGAVTTRMPRKPRRPATPTGTPRMARKTRRPRTPTAVRRNPFQS